jgi:hypothetical protein
MQDLFQNLVDSIQFLTAHMWKVFGWTGIALGVPVLVLGSAAWSNFGFQFAAPLRCWQTCYWLIELLGEVFSFWGFSCQIVVTPFLFKYSSPQWISLQGYPVSLMDIFFCSHYLWNFFLSKSMFKLLNFCYVWVNLQWILLKACL